MKKPLLLVALSLVFMCWGWQDIEAALWCHSRLVTTGDTKLDVLAKCGEPTFQEIREEEAVETFSHHHRKKYATRRVFVPVEEWTYNFGPHSLVHVLTFRGGVIVDIRTAGYGY